MRIGRSDDGQRDRLKVRPGRKEGRGEPVYEEFRIPSNERIFNECHFSSWSCLTPPWSRALLRVAMELLLAGLGCGGGAVRT